jgi:predicted Zn-dependent protease
MKAVSTQPFNLLDMFPLIGGNYRFSVLVKNEESKEFTSFEETLMIPGATPGIQMTSPVLGYRVVRAEAARRTIKPFQFGPYQLSVQPGRIFTRKDTLAVAFQVFGLTETQRNGGSVRYVLARDDQTALDRSHPLTAFPDLPSLLIELPLADLPPAHYALKVSLVVDGQEIVAGNEEFDLTFQEALPRPWYHTKQMPEPGDPVYALIIGSQMFNIGRFEEARTQLEIAYAGLPNSTDAALALARVEMSLGRAARAAEVLAPFLAPAQTLRYEVYVLAGQALLKIGDGARALDVFNQAASHFGINASLLNATGECFVQLARPKDAQAAWEKSLEVNPDQPEIRKKLEAIKVKK